VSYALDNEKPVVFMEPVVEIPRFDVGEEVRYLGNGRRMKVVRMHFDGRLVVCQEIEGAGRMRLLFTPDQLGRMVS
jgi:uncharacterized protein YodC (DUF2158 family)